MNKLDVLVLVQKARTKKGLKKSLECFRESWLTFTDQQKRHTSSVLLMMLDDASDEIGELSSRDSRRLRLSAVKEFSILVGLCGMTGEVDLIARAAQMTQRSLSQASSWKNLLWQPVQQVQALVTQYLN